MIDWDRVGQLRNEIGTSDFDEVVEMFLNETDEVIDRLRAGAPYPTLEAELHFLKGSALNLGLRQLAGLCHAGEKLAASGGQADLAALIQSYAASRQAFQTGLQSLDAA